MNLIKKYLTKRQSQIDRRDFIAMSVSLIMFLIASLPTISNSSIWFDEAFGAYLIRFDFFEIAKYTAADVHPPFYYWLLKIWSSFFGTSEFALRSMSVLFGAIALVLGYFLIRKLFSRNAASLAVIFMSITPMFIRYSQEARMYTLVVAIAIAATFALVFATETKKRKYWIMYGILVGLGMLTHYYAALIWITHWIWRWWTVRAEKPRSYIKAYFSKDWLVAHAVAIGLFLAWLPFFVSQLFTVQAFGFWIPPVSPDTIINFLTNHLFYQDVSAVSGWLTALFFMIVALMIVLPIKVYRKLNNQKSRNNYMLVAFMAFMPIILLVVLSMPPLRPTFIDRYLITSCLMLSAFLAISISIFMNINKQASKKLGLAIILVALALVIGVSSVWQQGNYNKNSHASNNTRQIIELIKSKSSNDEPLVAATPWLFYEAVFYDSPTTKVYYIEPNEYLYGSLAMLKNNDQFKIKNFEDFVKNHNIFWYVGYSSEGKLDPPATNLEVIQEVEFRDTVNGKPAYIARQFKIKN